MAVMIKCKMCGGDLHITEGSTVCECEYCGTKQTVPTLDNEKKLTLFSRAGRLLRNCEFDKASGVFENIVADFPEESEAYWGLVLCKYGIEYVDDPITGEKIPTCHRSSFESVLEDSNFEQACENTDAVARRVYREEARQLEELRKSIIEVSGKEEPYDIFISYKETDENGNRTLDSVIAQDIYTELTEKGYRVFFSRISLEDKLGVEYEPYIFAALNSAKVMLVVGTDYENFDAVWVKNEWSRFLKLIAGGQKKVLIPVFKNMDPYDMPKEFSKLAAQDMGKVGAMQDLLRGVDKLLNKKQSQQSEQKQIVKETVVVSEANSNTAPLLKRVLFFLEDGDWNSANEYCERVLDNDPENAQAYLGKLMAELHIRRQSDLENQAQPFDDRSNYQKTVRFADETLKETLRLYNIHIRDRNETQRKESIYSKAVTDMKSASSENAFLLIATQFRSISDYKDAETKRKQCMEKAEACRKDKIYNEAKEKMVGSVTENYEKAISVFQSISGWKDTDEQIVICQQKIAEIKDEEERQRIEQQHREEADRIARTRRKNKFFGFLLSLASIALFAVAVFLVYHHFWIPAKKYSDAKLLMDSGNYTHAIEVFRELGKYKDSEQQIITCQDSLKNAEYNRALVMMGEGKYDDAIAAFNKLSGYKDSYDKVEECRNKLTYALADDLFNRGEYKKAYEIFFSLNTFQDSINRANECAEFVNDAYYNEAISNYENGNYEAALEIFTGLKAICGEYKENEQYIALCEAAIMYEDSYQEALSLYEEKSYEQAIEIFAKLDGYRDSTSLIESCEAAITAIKDKEYDDAANLAATGKYSEAIAEFKKLNGYRDSKEQMEACQTAIKEEQYRQAVDLYNTGNYIEAYTVFSTLAGYKDAGSFAETARREYYALFDVGKTIKFGNYEQDNEISNGKEEIEWLVLARKNNNALLISKYVLDCQKYNNTWSDTTWEKCTLRKWLNETFLNVAFSTNEQNSILVTTVKADINPSFSTDPGKDTNDKIFLLSITEANDYFSSISARQCEPTEFAKGQGCEVNTDNGKCYWWLRSPGKVQSYAAEVLAFGSVYNSGKIVNSNNCAIRPAMWIDLGL